MENNEYKITRSINGKTFSEFCLNTEDINTIIQALSVTEHTQPAKQYDKFGSLRQYFELFIEST